MLDRVRKRNNVLTAVAGSGWGLDKKTLVNTYKATGRSVLNYAAPIWAAGISDSRWKELQRAQNAALRTATGCVLMSPVGQLHAETNVLPVRRFFLLKMS